MAVKTKVSDPDDVHDLGRALIYATVSYNTIQANLRPLVKSYNASTEGNGTEFTKRFFALCEEEVKKSRTTKD